MTYQPRPIDTPSAQLPDDLVALTERLSENAHDIWARQRLADGWTLGPNRDDARKHHPCLVPYAELSESEKQYDRNAAMETIKAMIALGYTIAPPRPEPADSSPAITVAEGTALKQNLDEAGMSLGMLLDLEQKLSTFRKLGASLPEVERDLGERLLRLGEPILAYDVVTEALKLIPDDRKNQRLRQLQALALARIGDIAHGQPDPRDPRPGTARRPGLGAGDARHPRSDVQRPRHALPARRPARGADLLGRGPPDLRQGLRADGRLLSRHQRRDHGPDAGRHDHEQGHRGGCPVPMPGGAGASS